MAEQHTSNGVRATSEVVDLGKRGTMATGICFLDHMIDQLTSHGQLGVTVRVAINEGAAPGPPPAPAPPSIRLGPQPPVRLPRTVQRCHARHAINLVGLGLCTAWVLLHKK